MPLTREPIPRPGFFQDARRTARWPEEMPTNRPCRTQEHTHGQCGEGHEHGDAQAHGFSESCGREVFGGLGKRDMPFSEARRHRSVVARVVCMAQDRLDLDVVACTFLGKRWLVPRGVKRVLVSDSCQHILGRPRCAQVYEHQGGVSWKVGGANGQQLGATQRYTPVHFVWLVESEWPPSSLVSGPPLCDCPHER